MQCCYFLLYFLSLILKHVAVEDMLWRINECNRENDLSMVGSFDVGALYLSIDKCLELILGNEFSLKNIDELEIGLYLSILGNKEERIKEGIYDFCPLHVIRRL